MYVVYVKILHTGDTYSSPMRIEAPLLKLKETKNAKKNIYYQSCLKCHVMSCHVISCVMCHVSYVSCNLSHVTNAVSHSHRTFPIIHSRLVHRRLIQGYSDFRL